MRLLLRLIALIVSAAALGAGWLYYFAHQPLKLDQDKLEFNIKNGSSLRSAANQMVDAGVPMQAWAFAAIARFAGKGSSIKAGTYEIARGGTPLTLLEKLVRGDSLQSAVTLLEGWTFRQVRAALADHPDISQSIKGKNDLEVLRLIGAPEPHPEGLFFPDTYKFAKGTSDLAILKTAYAAMQKQLATAWSQRAPGSPLTTRYQALILASIIEKETGRAEDRGLIGAVFLNRLRSGMKLQTDPAVIYGLGDRFDGNLRKRDLTSDGPYNTYTRPGLPPTPIAMPGLASINAALSPSSTEALYFVSRGDGTSHFSRSLDEHNRAVSKYQRRGG